VTVARGPRNAARFSRSSRLLRRSDFERVYRNGKKHFTGSMTVFFLRRDPPPDGPRVGLTVGRVLGGAVLRNRIRRRMREAVRLSLGELQVAADLVLHPRKSVLDADFAALCGEVRNAFAVAARLAGQGRTQES
jgi:ribonuclease P protein component